MSNALLAAALSLTMAGCQGSTTARADEGAAASSEKGSGEVAARIGDVEITLDELDEAIAGELNGLRQQMYDLRRAELKRQVEQRLFEAEAEVRGITVPELLKQEINDKVEPVTDEAMTALYEQYKSRLGGKTQEEVKPQLYVAIQQRNMDERRKAFSDVLMARNDVSVLLSPPRAEVAIPADAPVLGAPDAPVTIVAFSDYQCPFCHRAQATVEEILSRYEGKVKLVHRDYPLNIHPGAIPAAKAARCAGEQDRFWDYHRNLLSRLTDFSIEDLTGRAAELKLEPETFATCLASNRYDEVIQTGFEQGQGLGVNSTPTFFVNGRRILGAQPIETFVEVIEEELARSNS